MFYDVGHIYQANCGFVFSSSYVSVQAVMIYLNIHFIFNLRARSCLNLGVWSRLGGR